MEFCHHKTRPTEYFVRTVSFQLTVPSSHGVLVSSCARARAHTRALYFDVSPIIATSERLLKGWISKPVSHYAPFSPRGVPMKVKKPGFFILERGGGVVKERRSISMAALILDDG